MKDYIINLLAFAVVLALWLVSGHKLLVWLLGGLGMAISVIIMIYITGIAIHEVEE